MTEHRPWFRKWRQGVPTSMEPYPNQSLFGLLAESAERYPQSVALAFLGKHLSYRQLMVEVERFSGVLASLGVTKGDRVGLLLPNVPQYVIAMFAAARLGAITVGNNPLYTQRELAHQVKDSSPKVMIVLDQLYSTWAKVAPEAGVPEVIVTELTDYMKFPLNKLAPIKFKKDAKKEKKPWPPVSADAPVKRWSDLMAAKHPLPAVVEVDVVNDPAVFVYTGGTTGFSKGAMLSHRNVTANVRQVAPCITGFEAGKDGVMCVLPFFHAFGMVAMNFGISQGGKLVMVPRFELHMVLKQLAKEKPAFFPGVPRLFVALNDAPETPKFDLSSVKACISGAAPLHSSIAEKFHEVSRGAKLVEGYGLSECSPVVTVNPFDDPRPGTIGIPLPDTDCKIIDLEDPDREVAQGERGELCIKGPQIMLGYWGKPEATAAMIRNGWLHTGDVAVMDEDGFFTIVDRIKDMILVSGFNVYPTEVEDVINRHPSVARSCVVGIPDDVTGERVKAYVVASDGQALTGEQLNEWCRDPDNGLSGYRVPKEFEFRESLPETLIGKVLRRVLLEEELAKKP